MTFLSALALFGTIGTPELLVILFILVLLFGAAKLPQLGGAFGKTLRNFKQEMKSGMNGEDEDGLTSNPDSKKSPTQETEAGVRFCTKCGASTSDPEAAFCPKCGKPL
ncbi:MAG: twin-arginine translocase TatA/TatE family subunit [Acidobacteriota bacterium]|jgi:sec-independent protein translocase protein TatA